MKSEKVLLTMILLWLTSLNSFAGFEVVGNLSYKYIAQKGEKYSTVIKVHNTGSKDQEVKIYLRDYLFNYEGTTFYNEPGTNNRSNAPWIQFSAQTLLLKSNETQNLQIEITVPKGDNITGTYWSMLMLEGLVPSDQNAQVQLKLNTAIRYAIQMVTHIGKSGIGQLEFQRPGVVKEGNKQFFDFIMVNTGERSISPEVSMELFDAATGESVKVLKIPKQGMYPTTSTKWRFPLEGLPKGRTYKAVIVADGSGEDVFGLEYTIVI